MMMITSLSRAEVNLMIIYVMVMMINLAEVNLMMTYCGQDDGVLDNHPRSRDSKAEDSEGCRLQLNSLLYLRYVS